MSNRKDSFLDRFLVIVGQIFLTPFKLMLSLLGIVLMVGKVIFTFLGALVAIVILVITLLMNQVFKVSMEPNLSDNTVVEISLAGPLSETPNEKPWQKFFRSTSYTLPEVLDLLSQLEKDTTVKGVVIRLDQMELGPAQIEEIRGALHHFQKNGKKTLAYADTLEGMGNRGTLAYYLACACDEIWLHPVGTLDIQGLIMEVPFGKGALDKLDVKPLIGKRYEYKNAPDTFTETGFTGPHREATQALLESIMQSIIKAIQEGRDLTKEQVKKYIDGAPWQDQDAKRLGLIDRIAFNDEIGEFFQEKSEGKVTLISSEDYLRHVRSGRSPHHLKGKIEAAKQMVTLDDGRPQPVSVAVIYAEGAIVNDIKGDSSLRDQTQIGGHYFADMIRQAREDDTIQAIIFRINSPGGHSTASEIIRREIQKTISSGKKVIVSMGSLCASGGYWLASAASKIVAQSSTITGSIGVYGGKFDTAGFWEKIGIHWGEVHFGENAIIQSQTRDFTEQGRQNFDKSLDYVYDQFIKRVVESRHLSETHVREIAKGRVWSGVDAHKFGLVDELGGLDEAVKVMLKELNLDPKTPVEMDVYPKPLGLMQQIRQLGSLDFSMMGSSLRTFMKIMNQIWGFLVKTGIHEVGVPASQLKIQEDAFL